MDPRGTGPGDVCGQPRYRRHTHASIYSHGHSERTKDQSAEASTPPCCAGDLMARWTNQRWVSTLHRVVLPPRDAQGSCRRQSMAFFHNINPDHIVECIPTCVGSGAKYSPVGAFDFLMEKHNAPPRRWVKCRVLISFACRRVYYSTRRCLSGGKGCIARDPDVVV